MTKQEALEKYPVLKIASVPELVLLQAEARRMGDIEFLHAILAALGPDQEAS